ncbi:hypothetical protein BT96DRAFT_400893 [Gymnopus androsaceus JB14]|uniref:NB-ARC domain-containing protein n=1 Tax=Gymnopus androsaceus JB14 TaxID=1447944 RepID=A0A6A4GVC2_9AGAR|nr:hypothetical protein BT96DRAFT_400893 [Gymnopus androsaceus JB14]
MTENLSSSFGTQMFPHASHFNIQGGIFNAAQNVNITYADRAQVNVPAGYIEGMTDCPTSTLLFTGRETVLNILGDYFITDLMSKDIGRRKLFLLHGLGGAGKTQCALEFARKFKKSFSVIYFITAESENSIMASYYDIAMRNGSLPVQGWESGFRWFKMHEANWLIIMDNADDPQLSLGRFLPSCDHGNIIITSRNPDLMQIAAKI